MKVKTVAKNLKLILQRKQWIFKKMATYASFEPQQEQLTGHEVDKSIERELNQASVVGIATSKIRDDI
jgi:hypothetical protein